MKDFTDITFILDRSGSMDSIKKDVVGGYKTFVEDQKKLGDNASMTLVQFDNEYELVFSHVPIQYVDAKLNFYPRGMTALRDAVGRTIKTTGERLSKLSEAERPNKVMIIVLTDGEENASNEFSHSQIREMVKLQQNVYNWQFVFLGANIDSFAVGGSLGVNAFTTSNYQATEQGVAYALGGLSTYTSCLRTSASGVAAKSLTACLEDAALDQLANDTKTNTTGTTTPV